MDENKLKLVPGNFGKECPANGFHVDEKGEPIECAVMNVITCAVARKNGARNLAGTAKIRAVPAMRQTVKYHARNFFCVLTFHSFSCTIKNG